jgi:hypothetical protein
MLKTKRIDILVSSSEDVQRERSVAEQSIRWVAAEFNVPVNVSYCNGPKESKQENETKRPGGDNGEDGLLLCPCFVQHDESGEDPERSEQILNPGQYDLVINILWSRLGARPAPTFVMPDGSEPGSATEYEVAWALDQSKRTPGFPKLHVYWNRATERKTGKPVPAVGCGAGVLCGMEIWWNKVP